MAYVMSTWLRDLRDADPGPLSDGEWFPAMRSFVERQLADKRVVVAVAAASDRPDEILGYAVGRPNEALLWVQVRKGLRHQGLAKRLLAAIECGPEVPMAFGTALGKIRLRNPYRGRQLRSLLAP